MYYSCPNCRGRFDTCGICWGSGEATEAQIADFRAKEEERAAQQALREKRAHELSLARENARAAAGVPKGFFDRLKWLFSD